jgi:hypothetical protein
LKKLNTYTPPVPEDPESMFARLLLHLQTFSDDEAGDLAFGGTLLYCEGQVMNDHLLERKARRNSQPVPTETYLPTVDSVNEAQEAVDEAQQGAAVAPNPGDAKEPLMPIFNVQH